MSRIKSAAPFTGTSTAAGIVGIGDVAVGAGLGVGVEIATVAGAEGDGDAAGVAVHDAINTRAASRLMSLIRHPPSETARMVLPFAPTPWAPAASVATGSCRGSIPTHEPVRETRAAPPR